MKKLSLMLMLVLALGIVGVACSDDDAAGTVIATFTSGTDGNKTVFMTGNGFTVFNYNSSSVTIAAWRGSYTDDAAGKVTCDSTNWINNLANGETNTSAPWISDNTKCPYSIEDFIFTYATTLTSVTNASTITNKSTDGLTTYQVWTKS